MDLRRFLTILKRWAWLLIVCAVLAGGAAYAAGSLLASEPTYQGRAVVLVGTALTSSNSNPSQLEASRRIAPIYRELATSRPVLDRVAAELGLGISGDALRPSVAVTTPQDPPILTISATANDPVTAAEIANEVVRQLIAASPGLASEDEHAQRFIEQQAGALQGEIETLMPEVERLADLANRTAEQDQQLAALQDRLTELQRTYASLVAASAPAAPNLVTVLEEAIPPLSPEPAGGGLRNAVIAGLLGLVLATTVALVIEHLDDTVKSADDIQRTVGFHNLGEIVEIPRSKASHTERLITNFQPQSVTGEQFRSLRTNIDFLAPGLSGGLLITSGLPGEGKTTVATNLAVAFAQAERTVLLVDADLRGAAVHERFGVQNRRGFSDLLRDPRSPLVDLTQATRIAGLRVLTAGRPPLNPAELIGSSRTKQLLRELGAMADVVILDGPSVLAVSETAVLASFAESTVVVVGAGRTSAESLLDTREALSRAKATVVGTVLNRVAAAGARQHSGRYAPRATIEGRRQALKEDRADL